MVSLENVDLYRRNWLCILTVLICLYQSKIPKKLSNNLPMNSLHLLTFILLFIKGRTLPLNDIKTIANVCLKVLIFLSDSKLRFASV